MDGRIADDQVQVVVRDSGQGLTPEDARQAFEMFWQSEPLSSRRHSGLGLGLSIVRKLAELHGGTVTAESAGPGQGATFCVRLPRASTPA